MHISYHGKPVAEIRPIEAKKKTLEEHLAELERRGVIVPAKDPNAPIEPIAHRARERCNGFSMSGISR